MNKDIHTAAAAQRVKHVGVSAKEAIKSLLENLDDLLYEIERNLDKSEQDQMVKNGYLGTAAAAEYLDIPLGTLRQYVSRNTIRYYKPTGKNVYFKRQDLDDFMMSGVVPSNHDILSGRA
jgi:excisionase family DNA binding protein